MYSFPPNLYTDVRIEEVCATSIRYLNGALEDVVETSYEGAFIRVFDGKRWNYMAVSDLNAIEGAIETLAKLATPSHHIDQNRVVSKLQANRGEYLRYQTDGIDKVSLSQKKEWLRSYFPLLKDHPNVKEYRGAYKDLKKTKRFYSSKGAELVFDTQSTGCGIGYSLAEGTKRFSEGYNIAADSMEGCIKKGNGLEDRFYKSLEHLKGATAVKPGRYTTILSPVAAGIFAHESFGHKSEADFMLGDKTMLKEWPIGKKVGADILSIVADGGIPGSGFVPFDDEGTKSQKTFLIREGILAGRLHSATTAADLNEEPKGNGRSMGFEYEPMVRQAATYIAPGESSREELFKGIEEGIFLETLRHGSGMSQFTLAPSLAWKVKNGEIKEPVSASVAVGDVFKTLYDIDGLSKEWEIIMMALGGCGKMEQFPLPVALGGPYVRVKDLNIQ